MAKSYLSLKDPASNTKDGYLEVILPDLSSETGYKTYKLPTYLLGEITEPITLLNDDDQDIIIGTIATEVLRLSYKLKRGTGVITQSYTLVWDGSNINSQPGEIVPANESFPTLGLTLSFSVLAGNVIMNADLDNTGSNATFTYKIERL